MKKILLILAFLISVTSCGTITGTSSKIYFDSNPQGAEVIVAGKIVGKTPIEIEIKNDKRANIILRYEGYKNYKNLVDNKLSLTAILGNFGLAGIMGIPGFYVGMVTAKNDKLGYALISGIIFEITPFIIDGITGGFYRNKKLNNKIVFYDFTTGETTIIDR